MGRPLLLARRQINPPADLLVTEDDELLVQSYNTHATTRVEVRLRILDPGGEVVSHVLRHTPNTDRSLASSFHAIPDGYVLGAVALPTADDVQPGELFVTVALTRGASVGSPAMQPLIQEYLTSTGYAGYPAGVLRTPGEGRGNLYLPSFTDPLTGGEALFRVPSNARWRLFTARAVLTTSAAAGNRTVRAVVDDSTTQVYRCAASAVQAPSTQVAYSFVPGGERLGAGGGDEIVPLPADLYLPNAWRMKTATSGIDAGDQWSALACLVEEWLVD
jgi:hypothetical protein